MKTVDQMIADIIEREKGYNDQAADKGGATNLGISLKYLRGVGLLRGDLDHDGDIDKDDIRIVSYAKAAQFYKEDFFYLPRLDRIDARLHPIMFDMAVNHGPPRAIILLQKALRNLLGRFIPADGVIGPQTRVTVDEALTKLGFKAVENAVVSLREAFYDAIVAEDPSQSKFIKGWKARAEEFRV